MSQLVDRIQEELLQAIEDDALILPTLPEVAIRVREAAENPNIGTHALSRVISNDAALSARLIKVVNSPLLRGNREINDLQSAVDRLGINYTCSLAIGLAMEQMFQATHELVDAKLREVWVKSTEIAAISQVLCRHFTRLQPDQATLAGLVHQIGVLPILTYAEEHELLLADTASLDHVIERIHPQLGERILRAWEFPEALAWCRDRCRTSPAIPRRWTTWTSCRWPSCKATWHAPSAHPAGLGQHSRLRQTGPQPQGRHPVRSGPAWRPALGHEHAAAVMAIRRAAQRPRCLCPSARSRG